jgi:hypothetical protein
VDVDQYVLDFPTSLLVQSLVEGAAFLTIAVVASGRFGHGAWAPVAALGGLLSGAVSWFYFAEYAEMRWLDSGRIFEWTIDHQSVNDVLAWARIAGVVMIAIAFILLVRSSRPRPTPSGEVA